MQAQLVESNSEPITGLILLFSPFLDAAFFQYGHPIYSAKRVRFRLGHSKLNLSELDPFTGEEESLFTRDTNYVWSYISPEYPMSQVGIYY